MANKTADPIKLNLRLPKPLHKRLKQQARRNNVSLNTEIVNQLSNAKELTFTALLRAARSAPFAALMREIIHDIFVREGRADLVGEKRSELPSSVQVIGTEDQK